MGASSQKDACIPVATDNLRREGVRLEAALPRLHSQATAGSRTPRHQLPSLCLNLARGPAPPGAISLPVQNRVPPVYSRGLITMHRLCRSDDPDACRHEIDKKRFQRYGSSRHHTHESALPSQYLFLLQSYLHSHWRHGIIHGDLRQGSHAGTSSDM
jgi:hypothetical protein